MGEMSRPGEDALVEEAVLDDNEEDGGDAVAELVLVFVRGDRREATLAARFARLGFGEALAFGGGEMEGEALLG